MQKSFKSASIIGYNKLKLKTTTHLHDILSCVRCLLIELEVLVTEWVIFAIKISSSKFITFYSRPLCGSDKKMHSNPCMFEYAQCVSTKRLDLMPLEFCQGKMKLVEKVKLKNGVRKNKRKNKNKRNKKKLMSKME